MDVVRNVGISDERKDPDKKEKRMVSSRKHGGASQEIFRPKKVHSLEDGGDAEEEKKDKQARTFASKYGHHDEYKNISVGGGVWKYFLIFVSFFILLASGIAAYMYLPKAEIVIVPRSETYSVDAQIGAKANAGEADIENGIIQAEIISVSDEIVRDFETSGTISSSNQKAHGEITIYNEFSSSPQPLVATTRFEAPDGKIFRLVSGVVVPGMEKVGSENKAGAIEAQVIADQAGEEYNIEASSFTIPGFKGSGSGKYEKIYAKSSRSMTGGGDGDQDMKALTEGDISSAKAKLIQEAEVLIRQKAKESI
jgi:hypothetical protein